MKNNSNNNFIDPTLLYTPSALASAMQTDVDWIKRNLFYNRACRYKKQGSCYLVLGKWVIEWAENDHHFPGKDDDDS